MTGETTSPTVTESSWGFRFATIPGADHYWVRVNESKAGAVMVSAAGAELDREGARRLSLLLQHFADTGRLPMEEGP